MELRCEFQNLVWYHAPSDLYTCIITSAAITKPNTKIESIQGTHQPDKSNSDVEAILFSRTLVQYFPRGLSKVFPNLRALQIERCGLMEISRRDLIGLEGLEAIAIRYNGLKSLPNNLFTNMSKLTRISFLNNWLESLSSKLFWPIFDNNLLQIYLNGNTSIDSFYGPGDTGINQAESLAKLMDVIDINCRKPKRDDESAAHKIFSTKVTSGFEELWMSGRLSDFTICAGAEKFEVHKNILSIQSSAFSRIFEESESNEMEINGLSAGIVEDFLRYIYTGRISDHSNVMELFKIAAKMEVSALKYLCEEKILELLDPSNAEKIFDLAHAYSSDDLKVMAFNEIKKMFNGASLDNDLMNHPDCLKDLIKAKHIYDSLLQSLST